MAWGNGPVMAAIGECRSEGCAKRVAGISLTRRGEKGAIRNEDSYYKSFCPFVAAPRSSLPSVMHTSVRWVPPFRSQRRLGVTLGRVISHDGMCCCGIVCFVFYFLVSYFTLSWSCWSCRAGTVKVTARCHARRCSGSGSLQHSTLCAPRPVKAALLSRRPPLVPWN